MKFLVILICIVVNYLWLKDFDRFKDDWFFQFRRWALKTTAGLNISELAAVSIAVLVLYAVPLLTLSFALYLLAGIAAGLGTMLIHILVLLVAFDRTQPGHLAKTFLGHWREGDVQASYAYLQQTLSIPDSIPIDSERQIHDFFSKQFTYHCFEKMFVMFFWYMVAGPWGVAFCYVTYQLRDCQLLDCVSNYSQAEKPEPSSATEASAAQETFTLWLKRLLWVVEWLPLRLLGLTFSLVGNFVQCFDRVKSSLWDVQSSSADQLYGYLYCALSGTITTPLHEIEPHAEQVTDSDRNSDASVTVSDTEAAGQEQDETTESTDQNSAGAEFRHRTALETEALQALLERSQIIWLCVIALTAVFM